MLFHNSLVCMHRNVLNINKQNSIALIKKYEEKFKLNKTYWRALYRGWDNFKNPQSGIAALRLNAGSTVKFLFKNLYTADTVILVLPFRLFFRAIGVLFLWLQSASTNVQKDHPQ